jgi:hypothetical protein
MSTPYPHLYDPIGGVHPAVLNRRIRNLLLLCTGGLVPLVLALSITVAMPKPNFILVLGAAVGVLGVLALMLSSRYQITLAFLALYLGMLDGPIKLESASQAASGLRDLLIIAIGVGMLLRLVLGGERVSLPPLSAWVLAFVAFATIEAFNPDTHGFLKILAGYRQEFEWVPFFFFGYLVMRSKQRFRQLFLILGVIALANGIVGTVQSRLSPSALKSWGPGYNQRLSGSGGGRTYIAEGESHPRPLGLGSDSGFGGGVGVLALPGLVALLAAGRLRRRWPVILCCMGALLGIATAASRTSVVSVVVALASFALLSFIAGLRISRPLVGLMVVAALALAVGSVLVAAEGGGIFKRQERLAGAVTSVASGEAEESEEGQEGGDDGKVKHLSQIPADIAHDPFGLGLGTAGSVAGFGGREKNIIEEQKVSGGSAYNLLTVELGAPGLLLWIGLSLNVIVLGVRRIRRIVDPELRTYLVAILASFLYLTVQGLAGSTLAVSPAGTYLWFVPGVVAYWFAGPGSGAMTARAMTAVHARLT